MALSYRKRGAVWHARGTVRVGRETVEVREFSTGCSARADAETVGAEEEAKIRREQLEGDAGRTRRLTIADAFAAYLSRPKKPAPYDLHRIAALNEAIGHRTLGDAAAAWREWSALHPTHSAGTAARTKALLAAAINHHADAMGLPPARLPKVKNASPDRVAYLTAPERAAMLRAYNPHAACVVLVLAYQGMRSREATVLDWRNVDLRAGELFIPGEGAKSGRGRSAPMHPRVAMMLYGMWHAAGQPSAGRVFLSSRGEPYADTRGKGGNPLKRAHATACKAAGVSDFRLHDWRHDWATRMVRAGVDLVTLMQLGGWASLAMVKKYAATDARHMAESIRRIA